MTGKSGIIVLFRSLARGTDASLDAACVLAFVTLVAVTFAAVVFRYVFNSSLVWGEELARYLFVWLVFLGASIGTRRGIHISIDLFGRRLGRYGERLLDWLGRLAGLVFAAMLIVPGLRLVEVGMSNLSPALGVPMAAVYLAPVVGGIFIGLYLLKPGPANAELDGTQRW